MNRNTLLVLIKSVVVVGSIAFIIQSVRKRPELLDFFYDPASLLVSSFAFATACLLMLLNWSLEAMKWRILVNAVEPIGFLKSFFSIMSGVTASLIGPNRTGEFVGRVLHVSEGNRIKASLCTIPGSLSQLMVTMVFGLLSLPFVTSPFAQFGISVQAIVVWLIMAIILLTAAYFLIPGLRARFQITSMFDRLNGYLSPLFSYSRSDLIRVLGFSTIRYLVFTTQFFLMLLAFGVEVSVLDGLACIAAIFLFMALVPGFAIAEFTLRGSVALYLFAPITANSAGVLAASSALWLVNLVLPALVGAIAIYAVKTDSTP
ncbi:MAG: lysylphosphatidylglycerol synthase domain-containing protein [Bacteroidota bacterium]|jgi:hypothetical protein